MMKNWIRNGVAGLSMALATLVGGVSNASTVSTYTLDYPTGHVISGGDVLQMVFTDLTPTVVQNFISFALTITYSNANDPAPGAGLPELWRARIFGPSTPGAPGAPATYGVVKLTKATSPTSTTVISSTTPAGLFNTIASDLTMDVKFVKIQGVRINTMTVSNLKLDVTYDAVPPPIPLPAGGVLLVTGLGGIAVLRRRKA